MDPQQNNQVPNQNEPINQNPSPQEPKATESLQVNNHKILAALAYLNILILIPFFVARNNPFVKFHIKQGLLLVIIWVAQAILDRIPGIDFLMGILYPLISIATLILVIIGIINALTEKQKELPIIGQYGNKFKF